MFQGCFMQRDGWFKEGSQFPVRKNERKVIIRIWENLGPTWCNLISLGLKEKGRMGGVWGGYHFTKHPCCLCASHLSASTQNWGASEPQLVLLSLSLALMCFALKRK